MAQVYDLDDRGFDSRQGVGIFIFTASRPDLWPTQPPIQWVLGTLSLGIKRPGREADHSPSSSTEVKEWVELHVHSPNTHSWRSAKLEHRNSFTFLPTDIAVSHFPSLLLLPEFILSTSATDIIYSGLYLFAGILYNGHLSHKRARTHGAQRLYVSILTSYFWGHSQSHVSLHNHTVNKPDLCRMNCDLS
jgi:hypothetical protein